LVSKNSVQLVSRGALLHRPGPDGHPVEIAPDAELRQVVLGDDAGAEEVAGKPDDPLHRVAARADPAELEPSIVGGRGGGGRKREHGGGKGGDAHGA
jgi:hypothetical protein